MIIPDYDLESLVHVSADLPADRSPVAPWRVMASGRILARATTEAEARRLVDQIRALLRRAATQKEGNDHG